MVSLEEELRSLTLALEKMTALKTNLESQLEAALVSAKTSSFVGGGSETCPPTTQLDSEVKNLKEMLQKASMENVVLRVKDVRSKDEKEKAVQLVKDELKHEQAQVKRLRDEMRRLLSDKDQQCEQCQQGGMLQQHRRPAVSSSMSHAQTQTSSSGCGEPKGLGGVRKPLGDLNSKTRYIVLPEGISAAEKYNIKMEFHEQGKVLSLMIRSVKNESDRLFPKAPGGAEAVGPSKRQLWRRQSVG